MSKTIITTERLVLREMKYDDADFMIELMNSDGWLQFIGDRNVRTVEQAHTYLDDGAFKSYKENGFGMWCMELKDSGDKIGTCGLVNRDTLDNVDIGFALLPAYGGKGYAYEAAQATMDYAKNVLKTPKVIGITDKENVASQKLLNRLGLFYVGDKELNKGDIVQVYEPRK